MEVDGVVKEGKLTCLVIHQSQQSKACARLSRSKQSRKHLGACVAQKISKKSRRTSHVPPHPAFTYGGKVGQQTIRSRLSATLLTLIGLLIHGEDRVDMTWVTDVGGGVERARELRSPMRGFGVFGM